MNYKRKNSKGHPKKWLKKKRYNVPGLVVKGWGGFETQSVRQVMKQSFWKEYEQAYGA